MKGNELDNIYNKEAYNSGYNAGINGISVDDNPHEIDTEDYGDWRIGYQLALSTRYFKGEEIEFIQ